jgi:hypothetical protein
MVIEASQVKYLKNKADVIEFISGQLKPSFEWHSKASPHGSGDSGQVGLIKP